MDYQTKIILINAISISLLLILTIILTFATKLRNAGGIFSLIFFIGIIPAHVYNMCRSLQLYDYASILIYFGFTNTTLLPALTLFIKKQIIYDYNILKKALIHFLPSIIGLTSIIIFYAPLSHSELIAEFNIENSGKENWALLIIDIIVFAQMFYYFPMLLLFFRKKRIELKDRYSDSNISNLKWIETFIIMTASLFAIVFVSYAIYPRTDVWIIPILCIILYSYLMYQTITHPTYEYIKSHSQTISNDKTSTRYTKSKLDEKEMEQNARIILDYLNESQAFKDANFSLTMLAEKTGISTICISQTLNTYLDKTFFNLINDLRIEAVKKIIATNKSNNLTIEAIAFSCGFRSKTTFYEAFKKKEKITPMQFLRKEINT